MKVVIYARYSTVLQDKTSIAGQISNCEAQAAQMGADVVTHYQDAAQSGNDDSRPQYQQMFADSGYPEAFENVWSEGMVEAVVFHGTEEQVAGRIKELLSWGATEVMAHPITAGPDPAASMSRTLSLIAEVGRDL